MRSPIVWPATASSHGSPINKASCQPQPAPVFTIVSKASQGSGLGLRARGSKRGRAAERGNQTGHHVGVRIHRQPGVSSRRRVVPSEAFAPRCSRRRSSAGITRLAASKIRSALPEWKRFAAVMSSGSDREKPLAKGKRVSPIRAQRAERSLFDCLALEQDRMKTTVVLTSRVSKTG